MKLQKVSLTLILFFVSLQNHFAQETPIPELIDEFGKKNCEDLIARLDNLFINLENEPGSIGYAVIYVDENNTRDAWQVKVFLDGHTKFRKFDKNRFVVIKAKDKGELKVQYLEIPLGADKPNFDEIRWDFDLSSKTRPFIFNTSEWDMGPCSIGLRLEDYSNHLLANSDFRGHIVIFTKSKNEFEIEKANLLNKLVNVYNIPAERIRFFFVNDKSEYPSYELWLVPKKKK